MVFHLGMSGHWRVDPTDIGKHDHLLIETDEGRRLSLRDPRRFGSIDLVATDELADWQTFAALGLEPLGGIIDGGWLKCRFAGRSAAVKLLLLDQRIVAGLGNIYACEALFRARIDPRKPAGKVSRPKLDELADAIPAVLEEALSVVRHDDQHRLLPEALLLERAAQSADFLVGVSEVARVEPP